LANKDLEMNQDMRIKKFRDKLGPELQKCVEEVERLDKDQKAFKEMLREPFLPGNTLEDSVFDLRSAMARVREVMTLSKSYLLE